MGTAMKEARLDQRVTVRQNIHELPIGAPGRVVRKRFTDASIWIELDARHADSRVHPYAADESRATYVLAYPQDCEEV
jgi:hypothetical protein